MTKKVVKSDKEWQESLGPTLYAVLRNGATEKPGVGIYNKFNGKGVYCCAGCGQPLYKSSTKFDSGCGWPAFFDGIPGAINVAEDNRFGMERTEITCSACGGHLGHLFKGEGFDTPTDVRHCVNSLSLRFKEKK